MFSILKSTYLYRSQGYFFKKIIFLLSLLVLFLFFNVRFFLFLLILYFLQYLFLILRILFVVWEIVLFSLFDYDGYHL